MQARHRTKSRSVIGGSTTVIDTGEVIQWTYKEEEKVCDDVYKKHKDPVTKQLPSSECEIDTTERVCPTLSGTSAAHWKHKTAPMMGTYYPPKNHFGTRISREALDQYYAVQLIAQTHPFRPEFSIPVTIAEMLDIGSLFSLTAKTFAELAGNSYLLYKFGWVQFVQDIKTLSSITRSIERRIKEFDSLSRTGGLHRKVRLDHNNWKLDGNQGIIWSTYGAFVLGDYHALETVKVSGSIHWSVKPGLKLQLSKLEAFNLAVQSVFDLGELDASTLWNAIPWTWLADYLFDIGSWLQANENNDIVQFSDVCIIWEWKHVVDIFPYAFDNQLRLQKGRFTRTIYARDLPANPASLPPMRYSLLSRSQVLVLLSLYGKFRGGSY